MIGCGTSIPKDPQKSLATLVFEEKCKTSIPKIYKRIENVEGILLLKIRPEVTNNELVTKDRYLERAAMIHESGLDEYIKDFLRKEYRGASGPISENNRGMILYIPPDMAQPDESTTMPGFQYVDYIDPQTKVHYRYTTTTEIVGRKDVNLPGIKMGMEKVKNFDLNIYKEVLHKEIYQGPPPQYAVTYEDHVIEDERRLGIASSTLKVFDTKTGEILGEYTTFALGAGFEKSNHNDSWVSARYCPSPYNSFVGARTRLFATQILIPKK